MSDQETPALPESLVLAAVEAVLFAAGEPVSPRELADAFGGIGERAIEDAADHLEEDYRRRGAGLRVERIAGGLRLSTRSDVAAWVRQFFRQRNRTRLSPAALETLAIVAYRQPVTAPEIQAIRGVDSAAALKGLVEKKLLRILGRKKVVGNPLLYGTSRQFLVHFGLNALRDLPPIEDFSELLGGAQEGSAISPPVAASLARSEGDPFPVEDGEDADDAREILDLAGDE